jgi:Tfp pilus assembly protein PilV
MRRDEKGVTFVELLIATLISSIVILGITTFFLSSQRFWRSASYQASVQRAGALIAEDIGRRLRSAQSVSVEDPTATTGNCMPLSTNDPVLVIQDQASAFWCFYRDTSTPPQVVRCSRATITDPCNGGSVLTGFTTPVITANAWTPGGVTPCESAGGTCDGGGLCSIAFQSCATVPGAHLTFSLSDGVNTPLAFGLAFVFQRH